MLTDLRQDGVGLALGGADDAEDVRRGTLLGGRSSERNETEGHEGEEERRNARELHGGCEDDTGRLARKVLGSDMQLRN